MGHTTTPIVLVDRRGFVFIDDFAVPFRVDIETAELEFKDKDRYRSECRGSQFVRVDVQCFFEQLLDIVGDRDNRR